MFDLYELDGHLFRQMRVDQSDINGIMIFNNRLYWSDRTTVKIYKNLLDFTAIENYATTATKPNGLTTDGEIMYLAAGDASLIYKLAL